jgi:hypothetical protein
MGQVLARRRRDNRNSSTRAVITNAPERGKIADLWRDP